MMQHALVVEQPEQQRADDIRRLLVPAESGDHAIGGARVLDLEHRALAGLIRRVFRFRDHAVEARAFEALQPFGGDRAIARHRREVDRRRRPFASSCLERVAPLALRTIHDRRAIDRQQIEADERGRHRLRRASSTRDAAGCSRSCSASKLRPPSVAITISPSTTQPGGRRSRRAACSSGK